MTIEVTSQSRFVLTEPIIKDGVETFGRWKRPDFMKAGELNEDQILTKQIDGEFAGRPDQIALDVYGSPFLDWVVIMFNNPKNTLGWPQNGTVIKLPAPDIVLLNT